MGNVTSESINRLQQADCTTRPTICLDRCGKCCSIPFLVINGELQEGKSHQAILEDNEQAQKDGV